MRIVSQPLGQHNDTTLKKYVSFSYTRVCDFMESSTLSNSDDDDDVDVDDADYDNEFVS